MVHDKKLQKIIDTLHWSNKSGNKIHFRENNKIEIRNNIMSSKIEKYLTFSAVKHTIIENRKTFRVYHNAVEDMLVKMEGRRGGT